MEKKKVIFKWELGERVFIVRMRTKLVGGSSVHIAWCCEGKVIDREYHDRHIPGKPVWSMCRYEVKSEDGSQLAVEEVSLFGSKEQASKVVLQRNKVLMDSIAAEI
jgi:hypothetical protein